MALGKKELKKIASLTAKMIEIMTNFYQVLFRVSSLQFLINLKINFCIHILEITQRVMHNF